MRTEHKPYPLLASATLSPLLPFLGMLLLGSPAFSQAARLSFDRISTPEGLSQVSVYTIVQDPRGFLWFGTEDGLNRFDGYSFRVYRHDLLDSTSLSNNWTECLYIDRRGTLWVGTYGGGLNRYDHQTDRFVRYRHDPNSPQSLSNDFIYALAEDEAGNLWLATEHGLNRLDRTTGAIRRFQHNATDANSLIHNQVRTLHTDRDGMLWVGTLGGLCRYDAQNDRFARYAHDPSNPRSLSHDRVRCIYQDSDGTIWIGTRAGLDRYDATADAFIRTPLLASDGTMQTISNVFRVFEDRSGTLWIGTNDSGIVRYEKATRTIVRAAHHPLDATSLSANPVRAIYQDCSEVVWIGTLGGGLNRWSRISERFFHIRYEPYNANSLSGPLVFAIFEDRSGLLWVGTDGSGLTAYDRRRHQFLRFKHDPDDPLSLGANTVRAVYEDRKGALWVGTYNGGLNRYDGRQFVRYVYNPRDSLSLSHDGVRTILEDGRGDLWVGTNGGGLNRLDTRTHRFIRYRHLLTDSTSLSSDVVSALYEDRSGVLWIGTRAGLHRFEREKNRFVRYRSNPPDSSTLSNEFILSLCEDRTGMLWVGTMMGLNRFDRAANRFERFFEKDGLPNNTIYGILEDDQGFLWLSTNRGLSRFDPTTRQFRNYDRRDGLQDDEFNTGAYHRGREGQFYFGGVNGISAFFPERVQDNPHPPAVVLTSFKVFEAPVSFSLPIWHVRELELSYSQNFFSFEFAALDFTAPEKNQYAYMLEGFDADWIHSGTRRYASYTNVEPGRYRFRVKASNNDGVWNEGGLTITITIIPPFWKTWWFRVAAMLMVLSLGYTLYRYRVNRLLEVERMRSRIATDLHDDIGTSLSEIAITSDVARKSVEANPAEAGELLQHISGISRTLLDSMNDIVWAIRPDSDAAEDLIFRMQEFALRILEGKGIAVRFEKASEFALTRLRLPMDVRRNLYLIFKEMITNVAKHAACTAVVVRLSVLPHPERRRWHTLTIEVRDNGVGFEPSERLRGNGLNNMQRRAAAVGATVKVESNRGHGTSVKVEAPVRIP